MAASIEAWQDTLAPEAPGGGDKGGWAGGRGEEGWQRGGPPPGGGLCALLEAKLKTVTACQGRWPSPQPDRQ